MGRYMAAELISCGFFDHVDVIVPVPLHKKKQKLRGYNQSEWIARGIYFCDGDSAECEERDTGKEYRDSNP